MKKLFTLPTWRNHLLQVRTRWCFPGAALLFCFSFSNPTLAQNKVWDKTLGGSETETNTSMQVTSNGGYIVGGTSDSPASGDKTEGRKGRWDAQNYWIVKLKADGSKAWDKTIGGRDRDELAVVKQTRDGGYILGGTSQSRKSADKSEGNKGPLYTTDYWIVKLNKDGQKIWDKTIGGNYNDRLNALQQTADGGYILGGYSSSPVSGDKTSDSKGGADYWIVKLKADGSKEWDKTFGGNSDDILYEVKQTQDGGYMLVGNSDSDKSGDKTGSVKGGWLIKLKANGSKLWDKAVGNSVAALQQTKEGEYIIGGTVTLKNSFTDYWILKLKADGTKIWDKTLGGNKYDALASLQLTSDGGYLLGGSSNSDASGDKRERNQGNSYYSDETPISDYWIVKLKADGTKVWDKTIGGSFDDRLAAALQTPEGNYVVSGTSNSQRSGDKSENPRGTSDYWIVKLDNNINTGKEQTITFKIIPNQDLANSPITLHATASSGLPVSFSVVSGPAKLNNNQLTLTGNGTVTVKAKQGGNATYDVARDVYQSFEVFNSPVAQVWNKTYGGVVTVTPQGPDDECNDFGTSYFSTMVATPDGGYLLGGSSDSKKGGDKSEDVKGLGSSLGCANPFDGRLLDYWVVKIDANGRRVWDKTIGTLQRDELKTIVLTPDGGFLLGGTTSSQYDDPNSYSDYYLVKLDANGNQVWEKRTGIKQYNTMTNLIATPDGGYLISDYDYSVLKVDSNGNKVWNKTFPGGWYVGFKTMLATSDGGYLLGGDFNSTDPEVSYTGENLDYWLIKLDSKGNKLWDKTYGGSASEQINKILATPDGGYLLGGTSNSSSSGNKSTANKGGNDYWIVKVDATGKKLWDKTLGSSAGNRFEDMALTSDGGFVLGGASGPSVNGDKSEQNAGFWIVRTDALGQKIWDKTYGGIGGYQQQFKAIIAKSDGSILLGGITDSPVGGDRHEPLKGLVDYWIIKIKEKTPPVTTTWNQRYGGSGTDNFTSVIPTADGGYLSAGYTTSGRSGDKTQPSQGQNDYWIVKSDQNGKKLWDKSFGGSGQDYLNHVVQTPDGGYLLAGSSFSGQSGDKSQPSRGDRDFWIVKTDAQGNKLWDKRYGGTGADELKKVIPLASGRFILVGSSNSPVSGDKSKAGKGGQDFWIVKINADGTKAWDRCYGGNQDDVAEDGVLLANGDVLVGGSSYSGATGDHTQGNRGESDYWAIRLDTNGQKIWDRGFGGAREDKLAAVGTTATGNIYLAGTSTSKNSGDKSQTSRGGSDYWLVELSGNGSKRWDKTYGGSQNEELRAVQLTPDGGYLLAGSSASGVSGEKTQESQGERDYWVVKTDQSGNYQWDQRQGGSQDEELRAVWFTQDNGYLLAGRSNSGVSGDRTQPSQGHTDYWLVKIKAPLAAAQPTILAAATKELSAIKAYPNPFPGKVTVQFTLPQTQPATLRVLDGQGNLVATLFQEQVQANQTYQVEWQAENQQNGLYILQLQTPTGQTTQKVLLSR